MRIRSMTNNRTLVGAGVLLALVMLAAPEVGQALPATLAVEVASPSPPIRDTDMIRLAAGTLEVVFAEQGFEVSSTITFLDSSTILWEISTQGPGILQILAPLGAHTDIGPLPAGTYEVIVEWQDMGGPLIDPEVNSGSGALVFQVVPEPGLSALLASGFALLALYRRRRNA